MPEAALLGPPARPAGDYGTPDPEWLRIDWREHLRTVELPGAAVNFVEMGEGAPLLFVHGLSGCWQNWLENAPHFARRYRVIALDLPGFGNSPLPAWQIDIPAYGRLLHDFCEKLGIERCAAVVGNSMGGFISTEAVIQRPGRFERLVLVSAAGMTRAQARSEPAALLGRIAEMSGPVIARFNRAGLVRPRARYMAFRGVFRYPNRLSPELLYEQVEPALRSPGFTDALKSVIGYDLRDRAGEIEIPAMVVWGFDDRIVPVQAALSYHRRIPHSRLEIFERTGHLPQLERPSRFNRVLDEFLTPPAEAHLPPGPAAD
ncbi:MAG: alpha/beta hydrolase [Solirubrobacterales bacterium]